MGTSSVKPTTLKLEVWTRSSSAVSGETARSKSERWVLLVVPTSTSRAPERRMMSGMRNDPPISTSCPRETITSRPWAKAVSINSTAAALLLTTMAASAPVRRQRRPSTCSCRDPRSPSSRRYSRLL